MFRATDDGRPRTDGGAAEVNVTQTVSLRTSRWKLPRILPNGLQTNSLRYAALGTRSSVGFPGELT